MLLLIGDGRPFSTGPMLRYAVPCSGAEVRGAETVLLSL